MRLSEVLKAGVAALEKIEREKLEGLRHNRLPKGLPHEFLMGETGGLHAVEHFKMMSCVSQGRIGLALLYSGVPGDEVAHIMPIVRDTDLPLSPKHKWPEAFTAVEITPYESDPGAFRLEMAALRDALKRHGY